MGGLVFVLTSTGRVVVSSVIEMVGSAKFIPLKLLIVRGMRVVAVLFGLLGLIAGSLLLWTVFFAEFFPPQSVKRFVLLGAVCICILFSVFLCLWSAAQQSVINYLRLLGLPFVVLAALQFDDGPAFGLFYLVMRVVVAMLSWNLALSGVQHLIKNRKQYRKRA